MKINIAGWSCQGLRCPDVDIDLRSSDGVPAHVAFVQMPNGTGKTTTLDLLKGALSGEAARWNETVVRGLRRRGETNANGTFKVRLLVDGKSLTFELDFDFENGRVICLTTRPGSGGVHRRYQPPTEMLRFLHPSFLNLFVFNGELANDLFESEKTSAEDAIDALCQLYLLEEISGVAEKAWEKRASSRAGPKTAGTLSTLQAKRIELMARKVKLQRHRENAVKEMAEAKSESELLEAKIKEKTAGMVQDQSDLADGRTVEAKSDGRVAAATTALHQSMRLPLALSPLIGAALVRWKNQLDDLKLPEATSATFFTDLVKLEECICGTSMTDVMIEQIEARAKTVLSSSESGQLNIIKKDIELYEPAAGAPDYHEDLQTKLTELSDARREQLDAQQTVRALRRKILDAGGEQVKEWETQQKVQDARYAENEDMVRDIDDPGLNGKPGEQTFSLARIEREIQEATDKITDATDTVELRQRTATVQSIIERAGELARTTIKSELLDACNTRLAEILANDPIELEAIDGHLRLAGQEKGSEAQTLSVGYTFLMTLLERGDNRFPLLVDSPVGKMDGSVRRRVGRLIPELCPQFVTFVINTERAEFVPAVESTAKNSLHLTFFRKTAGTARLMRNIPPGTFVETATGVLVNDRSYFDNFDMKDEE